LVATLACVLKRLRIRNFKAWRDTGRIDLAPLTVFFGSNSSGKSSINHFMMMLRQTTLSPDRNSVFEFGDANAAVRLGSFRDVIFAHDLDRQLRFTLDWQLDQPFAVRDPRSRRRFGGNRLVFDAVAQQPPGRQFRTAQSEGFRYSLLNDEGERELAVSMVRDKTRPSRWQLRSSEYDLIRTPGRAWELPKPLQFYGFPNEASVYFQNSAFLADLELALAERLQSISYLGPLRLPPERLYSWSGNAPTDVGWQGGNTVQSILAASERSLNWKPKARTSSFEAVVARWLVEMGLLHSFEVHEIAPDSSQYEVRVNAHPRSEQVKLTDVGFGVSQVLPVVVQSFYAPAHSTVLMEQPEIHLHPAVQSALGDLFIAAITAREDGEPRQLQLIVERHSEHLLRRLQRRIAEGAISEDDVALYFCYPGQRGGSTLDRLELDRNGDILNWPEDFFGDELEDVPRSGGRAGHGDRRADLRRRRLLPRRPRGGGPLARSRGWGARAQRPRGRRRPACSPCW
jgi:predicted ATPase